MTPARPAIRRSTHSPLTPPDVDRILIIRLGALGDVVRTLPAVQAIRERYADARITWLVEPGAAAVLEGQSLIDQVLIFPRDQLSRSFSQGRWVEAGRSLYSFVRDLRKEKFELVLDFHSILKSGVLSRLSGSPQRVALAPPEGREYSWLFSNHRIGGGEVRRSRFERNAAVARFLGGDEDILRDYRFETSRDSATRMAKGWSDLPGCVVIHPGASSGKQYKRYAAGHYGEVARMLRESHGVRSLVIQGVGEGEEALARAVVSASEGAAELAPKTASAADLAALLVKCRLFVGADSGPLHLASVLGVPVVQILGPTDAIQNAPFEGTPSRQVRVPVACSPCRHGCEAAPCMALIPPLRVFHAAEDLLAAGVIASDASGFELDHREHAVGPREHGG